MDKFGYIRGRRGPRGPAGKDALDMVGWMPTALLEMFRKNTDASFYFQNVEDCIIYDKKGQPIGILNHGNSDFNAICLSHFQKTSSRAWFAICSPFKPLNLQNN